MEMKYVVSVEENQRSEGLWDYQTDLSVNKKTYTGAEVNWYVKGEDNILKDKGNQNAGSSQNYTLQGQSKKEKIWLCMFGDNCIIVYSW